MGESGIDSSSTNGGGPWDRQEWIRANFTQIFGTSIQNLQAQGIDPRQYAREHRSEIRQFAQQQRRQGIAVPAGRPSGNFGQQGNGGPNGPGPNGGGPDDGGPDGGGEVGRRYGYGGGRFGMGMRGGSAWIGILLVLFALRFLLVDSFAGTHTAVFWVLGIGGIMLVARVFLFSWLRRRRYSRRSNGRSDGPSGF